MPELPEVETIKNDLKKELVGHEILDITSQWPKKVLPSLEVVRAGITNKKITDVSRFAKLIVIDLEGRTHIIIHLKLTGQLLYRDKADKPDKFAHHIISLDKNKELRFADMRKFGFIKLAGAETVEKEIGKVGPEPLSTLNLTNFKEILSKRKKPVKLVLMDSTIISGIGNIYANEALFLAKINPLTPSNSLTDKQVSVLLNSIEEVLKLGLKYRGASDNTYVDAYGRKGKYQEHFKVYGRKGQPCMVCKTPIVREAQGGRGSFYCPKCQPR